MHWPQICFQPAMQWHRVIEAYLSRPVAEQDTGRSVQLQCTTSHGGAQSFVALQWANRQE